MSAGACTQCVAGTYSPGAIGDAGCSPCAAESTSLFPGGTSQSSCVVDVLNYVPTGGSDLFIATYADSARQLISDNGYWRYQRLVNDVKKINPYFTANYDLTRTSWAYSNFKSFYVKLKYNVGPVSLGPDAAWLSIYSANTSMTAGTVNYRTWYRSRASYYKWEDPKPATGEVVYLYVGQNPSTACTTLYFPTGAKYVRTGYAGTTTDDFVSGSSYTPKDFASNEILSRLSVQTNSNAAAGVVDVTIYEAGWCFNDDAKQVVTKVV